MKIEITLWQAQPEKEESSGGFCSRVAGLADGKPFCLDLWCEYDGRDVEAEPVWDTPTTQQVHWDMEFFDVLCQQQDWIDAMNADYKRWEALPQS